MGKNLGHFEYLKIVYVYYCLCNYLVLIEDNIWSAAQISDQKIEQIKNSALINYRKYNVVSNIKVDLCNLITFAGTIFHLPMLLLCFQAFTV